MLQGKVINIFAITVFLVSFSSAENVTTTKSYLMQKNSNRTSHSESSSNLCSNCSRPLFSILKSIVFNSILKGRTRSSGSLSSCKNRKLSFSHYTNQCLRTYTQYLKRNCSNRDPRFVLNGWPQAEKTCDSCLFPNSSHYPRHLQNNDLLLVSPMSTIVQVWDAEAINSSTLERGFWKKIKVTVGYYCSVGTRRKVTNITETENTTDSARPEDNNGKRCASRHFPLKPHYRKYNSCRNTFTQYTKHSCRVANSGLMIPRNFPNATANCSYCLLPDKNRASLDGNNSNFLVEPVSTIVAIWDSQAGNLETGESGYWRKLKVTIAFQCILENRKRAS